jgi:hypothetical protein
MTGSWASKVAKNVFPRSVEQENLSKALKEWRDTAGVVDFSENDDDEEVENYPPCDLCDHPQIKTGYVIENVYTGHTLTIGSECIKKFQPEFEVKKANYNHVLDCLNKLTLKIGDEKGASFIRYYNENEAFTPKQLVLVLTLLNRYNIPYTAACFKLKIRRRREQQQLKELTDSDVSLISKCLSPSQKRKLDSIRRFRSR